MLNNSFPKVILFAFLFVLTISCNEYSKHQKEKFVGFYCIKVQYKRIIKDYVNSNCIDSSAIILFYIENRSVYNTIRITAVKNPNIMSNGIDLITKIDSNIVVIIADNYFLERINISVPEWFYINCGISQTSIYDAPTWYYKETRDSISSMGKF